ncbi:uncharacterized protein A4U43_C01F17480 [Asparagus officinalis]|uniref:Uncharacterized protein n=1 Tax=Asparagus officinalis TaxID=4686 RepID=A0A5P1FQW4_ASPOF|nr:uncharacterized protein A4U43_C01F17480 [Asparagus officinalis]
MAPKNAVGKDQGKKVASPSNDPAALPAFSVAHPSISIPQRGDFGSDARSHRCDKDTTILVAQRGQPLCNLLLLLVVVDLVRISGAPLPPPWVSVSTGISSSLVRISGAPLPPPWVSVSTGISSS